MDEEIHPAHECERCGCHRVSRVSGSSDGKSFEICSRCRFVQGSEMGQLDWIIAVRPCPRTSTAT